MTEPSSRKSKLLDLFARGLISDLELTDAVQKLADSPTDVDFPEGSRPATSVSLPGLEVLPESWATKHATQVRQHRRDTLNKPALYIYFSNSGNRTSIRPTEADCPIST